MDGNEGTSGRGLIKQLGCQMSMPTLRSLRSEQSASRREQGRRGGGGRGTRRYFTYRPGGVADGEAKRTLSVNERDARWVEEPETGQPSDGGGLL